MYTECGNANISEKMRVQQAMDEQLLRRNEAMSVTIKDIAKAADVSLATVSRVLNRSGYVKETTREKVHDAIKQLHYTPSAIARSLSTNKTNTIGVIIPDINNPFFGEVIKGITQVADEHQLNIILCDTDDCKEKELKAIKLLSEQRIEGILMTPTYNEEAYDSAYMNTLDNLGIPVILMDGHVKYANYSGVFIDHVQGAYDGVEALIHAGHEKIAIINGRLDSRPAKERFIGYKKALNKYAIPVHEQYIFNGEYDHEQAYTMTKKILLLEDRPTAIFVSNNLSMLGCVKALNEQNLRIPDDMAILGFDKVDALNIIGMNISFINGPTTLMGKTGMNMLIESLAKQKDIHMRELKQITLLPELHLKGSEKKIE